MFTSWCAHQLVVSYRASRYYICTSATSCTCMAIFVLNSFCQYRLLVYQWAFAHIFLFETVCPRWQPYIQFWSVQLYLPQNHVHVFKQKWSIDQYIYPYVFKVRLIIMMIQTMFYHHGLICDQDLKSHLNLPSILNSYFGWTLFILTTKYIYKPDRMFFFLCWFTGGWY